jgi:hypothetical protein
MVITDFVLGLSVVWGLWWLSFPNGALRSYRALYGDRFVPRPFFIRLAGGVVVVISAWMFWSIGISR